MLLLFSAYLKTRLQVDVDRHAEAIIAIEEPEAHLHPNAVRSVWKLLHDLPGQKIVSTHSGDILSEVPIPQLRRIARDGNVTECRAIPHDLLTDKELSKFNHHVQRNRGELLFARCWLLVEGATDVAVFTECAELAGSNLHRAGVSIVEYSQAGQGIFIKMADALGIRWFLVSDGDRQGQNYASSARKYLRGRNEGDHIRILTQENMEVLLCESGYGDPYQKNIGPQQKRKITKTPKDTGYWNDVCKLVSKSSSKPTAAQDALLLMRAKHAGGESALPTDIAEILQIVTGGSV